MSIPNNLKSTRTQRPLTAEKMAELLALDPSFVILGMREIRVFFIPKCSVGVYEGAGTDYRAVMDVMDAAGYKLYHGSMAAQAARGLSRKDPQQTLKWLEGRKRFGMIYIAKDGEVTVREVRDWKATSNRHIVAFCERAQAERTFLIEGMAEVFELPTAAQEEEVKIEEMDIETLEWEAADATAAVSEAKWLKEAADAIQSLEAQLAALKAEIAKRAGK